MNQYVYTSVYSGQLLNDNEQRETGCTVAFVHSLIVVLPVVRARLKRDGTRAETRFSLSAKRTSPFKFRVGWDAGERVSSVD